MKPARKGQTAAAMRRATAPRSAGAVDPERLAQQRQLGHQPGQQPVEARGGAARRLGDGGPRALQPDHQVDRALLQVQPAIGQQG